MTEFSMWDSVCGWIYFELFNQQVTTKLTIYPGEATRSSTKVLLIAWNKSDERLSTNLNIKLLNSEYLRGLYRPHYITKYNNHWK